MKRLSPQLAAFLERLADHPQPRPKGTIVGSSARRAGYTDDEVEHEGERMSVGIARATLGKEWYLSTKFTGNELITEEGRRALAQHRAG